ncbi:hypothetical protein BDZ45DRAFT_704406 [Acephala macrosclerotiorum]|nr:hypothetical protein BDZ45DRAFT_704406 [Acephala macrosclerotiorum]
MADIIREAPLGHVFYLLSGNLLFQYPEERVDFVLPVQYAAQLNASNEKQPISRTQTSTSTSTSTSSLDAGIDLEGLGINERFEAEQQLALERTKAIPIMAKKTSDGGVMEQFTVNPTEAVLPLSLYVLSYGVGPLIFAPLSEIPIIGRNPSTILHSSCFFGSLALANAGATFSDMYSLLYVPYTLLWWFSAENWRWSLWESVWMAAPMLIVLLTVTPETSTPNILLRRAQRLRKLTGDSRLQARSEIDQRHLTVAGIAIDALIKPIQITIKVPAIFFVNVYTAPFYGIYYTFFEVFPFAFPPMYGLNLGEVGLAFLVCQVGATLDVIIYFSYLRCVFVYATLSYPKYGASLFARNDLCRFAMTAGSILYALPLFVNLGIGKGVSVLAGLSTLGIFGMVAIYLTGAKLRARSKFAQS